MAPSMRRCSNVWNARLPRCAPLAMLWRVRVAASQTLCRRCNCSKRRSEGNHLHILSFELKAVAVTIARLAGAVPHELIDQLLGSLNGLEPVLEAVPERVN